MGAIVELIRNTYVKGLDWEFSARAKMDNARFFDVSLASVFRSSDSKAPETRYDET